MTNNKFTGKSEYIEYEDGTRVELAEDDSPPFSDEEWASAGPAVKGPPAAVLESARKRGRPPKAVTKARVNMSLDPDVVEALRASGPGWQTRVNAHLREWLQLKPEVSP